MNNHFRRQLSALFVIFVATGCASGGRESSNGSAAELSGDMQKMGKDVRDLIPYIYNREAFHESKNHTRIASSLKNFSDHVHKVTPKIGETVLGDDPLVAFSLESLES